MNKLKKISIVILLSLGIVGKSNAGIPVLSPTELVQAVLEYTQILKDYEEQLAMVQQGVEQYEQMQTDYLQALKEWEHLLEQCQAYKDLWGNYNWDSFLAEMSDYFLQKKSFTDKSILELYNDPNYRNSRTLVMAKNGKVYTYEDAKKMLDTLKIEEGYDVISEELRVKENQFNTVVLKDKYHTNKSTVISDFADKVDSLQTDFNELGDNSQLATAQYHAKLQVEALNIQIEQLNMMNELISQQNQTGDLSATKMLQAQQRSIEKAKQSMSAKYIPTNKPTKIDF